MLEAWQPKKFEEIPTEKIKVLESVLSKMPDLPLSVQKIITVTKDDNVTANQLAEIVSSDPVLVSKILTTINSTYYGINKKIDNLRLAIVLLGFNEIKKISLYFGLSAISAGMYNTSIYNKKKIWEHSFLVSVVAEQFAEEDNTQQAGTLSTIGILHDIGKFALLILELVMRKKGLIIPKEIIIDKQMPLTEKEERIFGVNHSMIGRMLANKWNLSERIKAVLEYHHYPLYFGFDSVPVEYKEDVAHICLSDIIVNLMMDEDGSYSEPDISGFQPFGYNPPIRSLITPQIRASYDKGLSFMASLS